MFWDMQVLVILGHASKINIWALTAVKMRKIIIGKSHRHLESAIGTKIEIDQSIAILNFANRLTILGNYERRQILILKARLFGAIGLDRLGCGSKLTPFTVDGSIPALLYHAPITLVAIGSNHHASTTRSNAIIHIITKILDEFFVALNEFWFTLRRHITTIG